MAPVASDYRSPASSTSGQGHAIKLTARIVAWNKGRGFGTLLFEKHQIPFTRDSFVVHHKSPEVGDIVEFRLGRDAHGQMCALEVEHHNDGGRIRPWHLFAVAVLMVAPGWAAWRLAGRNDWRLVAGVAGAMSAIAFLTYWLDKLRARHGQWRVAETTLHLVAALGGWPGAYLAQKHFNHKTGKVRFVLLFWLIVVGHEFIAFDYLQGWAAMQSLNASFMQATMPSAAAQ